jgi:hypothetical protein
MKKLVYFKKGKDDKDIQLQAYLLWEKAGKPEGMSDYFWNMASEMKQSTRSSQESRMDSWKSCNHCHCNRGWID